MGDARRAIKMFGPWRGVNEHPAFEEIDQVEDAWNVDFEEGRIKRRRGRLVVSNFTTLVLSQAWYIGTPIADITAKLTDNDTTTQVTSLAVGDYYYIGSAAPFKQITWNVQGVGATNATTLTYQYWNGSAWASLPMTSDTTSITGGSPGTNQKWLCQSGNMVWSSAPAAWAPGNDYAPANQQLFWVKIANTGANPIVSRFPAEASLVLDNPTGEVNGLFEYRGRNGDRQVIICVDLPGLFTQTTASPAVRIFRIDFTQNAIVPIAVPKAGSLTGPGARWKFMSFKGQLLLGNGIGPVMRYDGANMKVLEALPGRDASEMSIGAKAYLGSVPRGKFFEVFRNRVALGGVDDEPNTFYLCEYDNSLNILPGDAPIGGPNVWPADKSFDAVTMEGDPEQGFAVVNDRLCVVKRESIFAFDDGELRQISGFGCVAPGTIAKASSAGDAHFFLFLSTEGVIMCDGSSAKVISGDIERTLREVVTRQALPGAVAAIYKKRHEYRLYVPAYGSQKNNLCLIYNYKNATWTKHAGVGPLWMNDSFLAGGQAMEVAAVTSATYGDTDEQLLTADYSGQIWREDVGNDDNGTLYWSAVLFPAANRDSENVSTWRYLREEVTLDQELQLVYVLPDGMSFRSRVGGSTWSNYDAYAAPTDRSGAQPSYSATYPINWSTKDTTFGPVKRLGPFRHSIGKTSRSMQIGLLWPATSGGRRWELKGLEINFEPHPGER